MEHYPKVTCEACGQAEIVDTDESRLVYKTLDIWLCRSCAYIFTFVMEHVREASGKAKAQGDMDALEEVIIQMQRTAKLFPLNNPLPRPLIKPEGYKNRLDSIIMEEDET